MGRTLLKSLLLGSALIATGCATTAKGLSQSAVMTNTSTQTLKQTPPAGTALAVLRYPAFIEPEAEDAYYDAFESRLIGGASKKRVDQVESQALADSVVLKSNYFALSVFKEMAARLPEHSVLLSPHKITLDANGQLTSEPMTQAESLPNILAVDFASYTFPDSRKMMGKEPLTFGDLVTPLVTVRTDHRAAVPTQGVLMASAPLISRAAGNGRESVSKSLDALQAGNLVPSVPELDFIAHLSQGKMMNVQAKSFNSAAPNAVTSYPLEKIKLNSGAILSNTDNTTANIDPLQKSFSAGFANQIIGILNQTDMDKASMAGRASAIADFDSNLGALTLVGSKDADYLARYRYAERLLEAEQKYLSVQSLRLFDGVHNGEMGAQVRDMLKAEYQVLEKRRALARKQNAATALAILGAVAAGGAIASGDGNQSYAERLALDALIAGTITAGQQAFTINKQSKAVSGNYLASIVPALEEQTEVQVSLIDSNETITAIRYEDLKAKLQTLYNDKQRSLDTVATRCGFTNSGTAKTGTWLGACENGMASGTGVGVIRNADGTAMEYYGYASGGQANGPGYLIKHSAASSMAIEGNFSGGQANGAMREYSAGQPTKLRNYLNGQAAGAAPAGSVVASPFETAGAL